MKKNFAILFALIVMAFVANTAFAESSDCTPVQGPVYTDTATSIR